MYVSLECGLETPESRFRNYWYLQHRPGHRLGGCTHARADDPRSCRCPAVPVDIRGLLHRMGIDHDCEVRLSSAKAVDVPGAPPVTKDIRDPACKFEACTNAPSPAIRPNHVAQLGNSAPTAKAPQGWVVARPSLPAVAGAVPGQLGVLCGAPAAGTGVGPEGLRVRHNTARFVQV
jgi:hypothetical protein